MSPVEASGGVESTTTGPWGRTINYEMIQGWDAATGSSDFHVKALKRDEPFQWQGELKQNEHLTGVVINVKRTDGKPREKSALYIQVVREQATNAITKTSD